MIASTPLFRRGNRSTETSSHLPKVTQPANRGPGCQLRSRLLLCGAAHGHGTSSFRPLPPPHEGGKSDILSFIDEEIEAWGGRAPGPLTLRVSRTVVPRTGLATPGRRPSRVAPVPHRVVSRDQTPCGGGALLYLRLPQAPSAPSQAASGFQAEGKAL